MVAISSLCVEDETTITEQPYDAIIASLTEFKDEETVDGFKLPGDSGVLVDICVNKQGTRPHLNMKANALKHYLDTETQEASAPQYHDARDKTDYWVVTSDDYDRWGGTV